MLRNLRDKKESINLCCLFENPTISFFPIFVEDERLRRHRKGPTDPISNSPVHHGTCGYKNLWVFTM